MPWTTLADPGTTIGGVCTDGVSRIWVAESTFTGFGFWEYNPTLDTYTPLADLPWEARSVPFIYDSVTETIWMLNDETAGGIAQYDIATDTWDSSSFTPDPEGSCTFAAFGLRGREVIVAGGYTNVTPFITAAVRSYNLDTDTWTSLAALPDVFAEFNGAWVGSLFYMYGAWDETASNYLPTAFAYDAVADDWTALPTPAYNSNTAGSPMVAAITGDLLVGVGGYGDSQSNATWLLSNNLALENAPFDSYMSGCAIGDTVFIWGNDFSSAAASLLVVPPAPPAAQVSAKYWAPGEFPSGSSSPLSQTTARGFMAHLRNPGQGSITNPLTAGVQPAVGGMVTFDIEDGISPPVRAFASLVRKRDATPIAPGEEAEQAATFDMPGHLAKTSEGLILPPSGPGSFPAPDVVYLNWTHPRFDDSSWTPANGITQVYHAQSSDLLADGWPAGTGSTPWSGSNALAWSAGWSEPNSLTADIIGPDDGSTLNVSNPSVADQNHYFRQWFYCSVAGRHLMAVSNDNLAEYWVDNVLIATFDDWQKVEFFPLDLSVGWHVMCVYLQNFPQITINPSGYAWVIYRPGYPAPFVAKSIAADTVHVEYQAVPPGMTATEALDILMDDVSTYGGVWIDDIVRDWTGTQDSNSVELSPVPNLTAEVGSTLLDFIMKLQASYVDIFMDPNDWTLHIYDFGTWDPPSSLALAPGNILRLTHKTESPLATKLLIRSDGLGWTIIGTGEVMAFLSLGSEISAADIVIIGEEVINIYGQTRLEITVDYAAGVAGSSSFPWLNPNLVPGAMATAPGLNMAPTSRRVMALGVSQQTGQENLQVKITLNDRIQEEMERVIQELKSG